MHVRVGGGLFIVSFALIGWITINAKTPEPVVAKEEKKANADDRDELAAKLLKRVTIKNTFENVALKDVLTYLNDEYELNILVDSRSLSGGVPVAVAQNTADEVLNIQVNLPAMKNVRLATVLKHITDQLDAVTLLYADHLRIVGSAQALRVIKPLPEEGDVDPNFDSEAIRAIPLVHANFKQTPLADALRDVELRTNCSIVLASRTGEKASTPVTARFTNVPVETAVATLAESAGLMMVRKGNVLLVTTPERAKELAPPIGGMGIFLGDPQVEELTRKVAELEKTIELLKKK